MIDVEMVAEELALAEMGAVVGGHDPERRFGFAAGELEQATELRVGLRDPATVEAAQDLEGPGVRELAADRVAQIRAREEVVDARFVRALRQELGMRGGAEGQVGIREVYEQEEGHVGIAARMPAADRFDDVESRRCRASLADVRRDLRCARRLEDVESLLEAEIGADHRILGEARRLVARVAKLLGGHSERARRDGLGEQPDPMSVDAQAREEGGVARDGLGRVAEGEGVAHALGGEAVEIRGDAAAVPGQGARRVAAIARDGVGAQALDHDQHDRWTCIAAPRRAASRRVRVVAGAAREEGQGERARDRSERTGMHGSGSEDLEQRVLGRDAHPQREAVEARSAMDVEP